MYVFDVPDHPDCATVTQVYLPVRQLAYVTYDNGRHPGQKWTVHTCTGQAYFVSGDTASQILIEIDDNEKHAESL